MNHGMRESYRTPQFLGLGVALCLAAAGCSQDKPAAKPGGGQSTGGESTLDRAGRNIDEAHEQFKQDIKPVAKRVDETTNAVVDEGKKAAHKVANAVDGSDDAPAKPAQQQQP
jgi:hypothetical protein